MCVPVFFGKRSLKSSRLGKKEKGSLKSCFREKEFNVLKHLNKQEGANTRVSIPPDDKISKNFGESENIQNACVSCDSGTFLNVRILLGRSPLARCQNVSKI